MNQEEKDSNRYEILVVDDLPDILESVREILLQECHSVTCKNSGEEALSAAKSVNFDLILLDIGMPGMDGFEVFRQLKRDPKTKDIPIIFVTIKPEFKDEAFELGAVDYITKPFHKFEILAKVGIHAQLYRLKKILSELSKLL